MIHGDKLGGLPASFHTIATTKIVPFAGIAHESKPIHGIKFQPEVTVGICHAKQDWTVVKFVDKEIARIRSLVGERGQILGAISGGVDSVVAVKLMDEAIREPVSYCSS